MLTTVIFDCDGTLLDSMPLWHALENNLAQRAGIVLTSDQIDLLNANTLPQTVAYFHATYGVGESFELLLDEARSFLLDGYHTYVDLRKGAYSLLHQLYRHGVKLAVLSSSPSLFLKAGLERMGIYELFEAVISAEDEGASKRDYGFVRDVFSRLKCKPEETCCIDDSVYALEVMRCIGAMTIGIYDSDAAGTFDELQRVADRAVRDFDNLDLEELLSL